MFSRRATKGLTGRLFLCVLASLVGASCQAVRELSDRTYYQATVEVGDAAYLLVETRSSHSRKAIEALEAKDWVEAIKQSELAIDDDSNEPDHHFFLGLACEGNGDLERALECYQEAVRIDSEPKLEYVGSRERALEKTAAP
jgi:tetratricopeptide (TPR) repeat protein